MKLYEIIQKCDSDTIINKLIELYPEQKDSAEGYYTVLEKLRYTQAVEDDDPMVIVIQWVEPSVLCDEGYVHVSGTKEGSDDSWALEFSPWEHWLDWDVFPTSLATYKPEEIVAHCLWEMTYMGFEQEEIQEKVQDMVDQVEDIKNGISQGKVFKSVKDMLEDLENED